MTTRPAFSRRTSPASLRRSRWRIAAEVAPSILARDLDGLHSFQVWRRPPEEQEGPHEFLTAMTFEDMGAEVRVRFVERNPHRVADHDVTLPSGTTVHNPLRVLAHPDGSEVVFTVRQIELTDEEFDRDCALVADDLARLRAL